MDLPPIEENETPGIRLAILQFMRLLSIISSSPLPT
jgi:hypothetical protein